MPPNRDSEDGEWRSMHTGILHCKRDTTGTVFCEAADECPCKPVAPEPPRWRLEVTSRDLDWLEYAIADYIARWGEQWTGAAYSASNIAGMPTAMANMAMTVIRKNLTQA